MWTNKIIRKAVVDSSQDAITNCSRAFHRHSKDKAQGLEAIFEKAFCKEIACYDGWKFTDRRPRRVDENTHRRPMRPDGWIDAIAEHKKTNCRVGFEFKVCPFPRTKNAAPEYDIDGIAWDFGALHREYGKLDFAYCLVLLYGGFVAAEGLTPLNLHRYFHNSLYANYEIALRDDGIYSTKSMKAEIHPRTGESRFQDRNFIKKVVRQMGLGQPFVTKDVPKMNFCIHEPESRLAVVGYCARMAPGAAK
jgi:hypothetical protein